jgi:hypothetical protein
MVKGQTGFSHASALPNRLGRASGQVAGDSCGWSGASGPDLSRRAVRRLTTRVPSYDLISNGSANFAADNDAREGETMGSIQPRRTPRARDFITSGLNDGAPAVAPRPAQAPARF